MTNFSNTIRIKSISGSPDGYGTAELAIVGKEGGTVHMNIDFEDVFFPRMHLNSVACPELGDKSGEVLQMFFDNESVIHGTLRDEFMKFIAQ